jgi:hypothetical protein
VKSKTYNFDWHLLALHIIYFVLLLWVYTTYFLDVYGYIYAGLGNALNINKAIFALFAIMAAFALLRNNGLPSYFFLNIIIAPSFVIFSGSDLPYSFVIVIWNAFAILAMVARFFRLRRIRAKQINPITLLLWLAGLSLFFIASIIALGGDRFINFNLSLVYEFRRKAAAVLPGVYEYLMSNFSQAMVPLGIVLSLFYKKRGLLFVFIFCSIMIFALSSQKGALFIPIAVIFVYWFSRHPKVTNLTMLALSTVVLIGALDFYLRQSSVGGIVGWFSSLAIYRTLFGPSLLNRAYLDFFSVNPYCYWADSKFSVGLIVSPYNLGIPFLIGREVFGNADMCANTGWIGSGMAQAGYFGIALYSVLIGLFLSLLDAYAKKLGYSMAVAIFLIPVMVGTTSSDLSTMLLSNGLFALLLIVTLIKPDLKQAMRQRVIYAK